LLAAVVLLRPVPVIQQPVKSFEPASGTEFNGRKADDVIYFDAPLSHANGPTFLR
jgi:hypothetical protein